MQIPNRPDLLRKLVAQWFSYIVLYNEKYVVVDSDVSWDCSGSLSEAGQFCVGDYASLEDFSEEPTGASEATYVSGCGLHFTTYKEDLLQLIHTHMYDLVEHSGEIELIVDWQELPELEAVDDRIYDLHQDCLTWSCAELLSEGTSAAMKEHAERQARRLEARAQMYAGQLLVEKFLFDPRKKLDRGTEYWQEVRSVLAGCSERERTQIAHVLNCSNSIRQELAKGLLPKP